MRHIEDSPSRPFTALLVGTEHMLLYTRKAILEDRGIAVTVARPAEAVHRLRGSDYDVVITCHTLKSEEAKQIVKAARTKTHIPGLICFTRQPFPTAKTESFDASVWSLSTPEEFLDRVFAVLPSPQNPGAASQENA